MLAHNVKFTDFFSVPVSVDNFVQGRCSVERTVYFFTAAEPQVSFLAFPSSVMKVYDVKGIMILRGFTIVELI